MTRVCPAVLGAVALAALSVSIVPASANPPMGGPRMGPSAPHGGMGWRGPAGPRYAMPGGPRGGAWGWNRNGVRGGAAGPYGWRNGPQGWRNGPYGCRGGWGCAGWANAGWGWGGGAVVVDGAPVAALPPVDPGPPSLPVGGVLPSPIGAPVLYRIDDRSKPGARGPAGAKIISIGKPQPMPGIAASTYSNGVGRPVMYTLVAQ
jgi:hypothetical protein